MLLRLVLSILLLLSTFSLAQTQEEAGSGEEEAVVVFEEIAGEKDLTGARPWRAPDFSNQEQSLGWVPQAFDTPAGLEINVQFWIDIYTKYTTDQGLLHDSEYIDLIYETLDFTHISARTDLSEHEKHRMKSKAVKEGKKRIVTMLKKLQQAKDSSQLSMEEKKVWDYFQRVDGKNKFIEATKKNRLRFQLGQRDRMIQGIFFSGRYLEEFEQIFREAGLPIELTRLPFVESSFNVLARSKVGASGLWQIMRYTGRPFLMINATVDKRNYPKEATRLAAKLLRMNYNMLGAWPLAVTGYNHGPAGVLRLTKQVKSRELFDLGKNRGTKRRLGFASRNFYPSFLAVLEVEKNAPKYFGTVFWSKALNQVEITLNVPVRWSEILNWFDGKDRIAQIYNPHITYRARKFGRPIPTKTLLSVPLEKKDIVLNQLAEWQKTPDIKRSINQVIGDDKSYVVAQGDSIFSIAKDFGVNYQELIRYNNLSSPDKIKPGQKLKIP